MLVFAYFLFKCLIKTCHSQIIEFNTASEESNVSYTPQCIPLTPTADIPSQSPHNTPAPTAILIQSEIDTFEEDIYMTIRKCNENAFNNQHSITFEIETLWSHDGGAIEIHDQYS